MTKREAKEERTVTNVPPMDGRLGVGRLLRALTLAWAEANRRQYRSAAGFVATVP